MQKQSIEKLLPLYFLKQPFRFSLQIVFQKVSNQPIWLLNTKREKKLCIEKVANFKELKKFSRQISISP